MLRRSVSRLCFAVEPLAATYALRPELAHLQERWGGLLRDSGCASDHGRERTHPWQAQPGRGFMSQIWGSLKAVPQEPPQESPLQTPHELPLDAPPVVPEPTDPALVDQAIAVAEQFALEAARTDSPYTWWAIDLLNTVHATTGWPWWATIFATNMFVRAGLLPFTLYQQRHSLTALKMKKEGDAVVQMSRRIGTARSAAEHAQFVSEYNVAHNEFLKKHKKNIGSSIVGPVLGGLLPMVVIVSQFTAVSTLTAEKVPSFTREGLLWFVNLTMPDAYYGLPIISSLVTFAFLELSFANNEIAVSAGTRTFFRVMAFAMVPFAAYVSSATCVLIFSSSLAGIAQSLLLRNKAFRRKVGLPDMQELMKANKDAMAQYGDMGKLWDQITGKVAAEPAAADGVTAEIGATKALGAVEAHSGDGTAAVREAARRAGVPLPPPPGTKPVRRPRE